MFNFEFYNPTKIIFGKEQISKLDSHIPKDAKVLILYGGGSVKKFGTLDKVIESLANRTVIEFGGIEANPKYETLMKAVQIVKEENIDFLLAVGGGSVIDGTKFVNLAANYEGDNTEELLTDHTLVNSIEKGLPIGTVLTLPATGSEMNMGAVISHKNGKFPVFSTLSFPRFSILDPTVTYTLPSTQVANGIVDTFIHTTEQYVTYQAEGRFQDRTAEGILQTLIEVGKKTIDNPTDYDARANLVWCATMALNGLIGARVPQDWATHTMGHELTALFGIDHGKTLAILQPAIWSVRKDKKRDKLIQYAERIWGIKEENDDVKIDLAINKTREFFESLGIKTHLSDYGITHDKINIIINNLEQHGHTNISETNDLDITISRKILEKAM
jgi:NADP-dependent alcohol dehydrogenase